MPDQPLHLEQMRPALTVAEQCEHMSQHGIKFEKCNKDAAKKFLLEHTYFFKLKAFDTNFIRDDNGIYRDLDFAYLQDLSIIDFRLRMLILRMTGDIEHALRIRFNRLIQRTNEDGYQVIKDYEAYESEFMRKKGRKFELKQSFNKSIYTQGMIDKYLKLKPVWLFWETCTLSDLIHCYHSFLDKHHFQDVTYSLLYGVRLLRNASSHHNCLLIPNTKNVKPTKDLTPLLDTLLSGKEETSAKQTKQAATTDPLIHDLSCVLISHINLVESEEMRHNVESQITEFLNRMQIHKDWYREDNTRMELLQGFDNIESLLSSAVDFNRRRDNNTLCMADHSLLAKPNRKPVRHGRRRPSSKTKIEEFRRT